jgi:hypothetical protein
MRAYQKFNLELCDPGRGGHLDASLGASDEKLGL